MKKNESNNNQLGVFLCSSIADLKKSWEMHSKDIYVTLFITCGKLKCQVNGRQFVYKENNIVFFRIGDRLSFSQADINTSDSNFECYAIYVNSENYNDIMNLLGYPNGLDSFDNNGCPHVSECVDIQFNKMIREIKMIHSPDVSNSSENFDAIRLFVAGVYNRYVADVHQKTPKYINVPKWFNNYYELLDDPKVFSLPFSQIIELSGKTREHISRLFKNIVGINISDYINSKRISYACQLLENPKNHIQDIAIICGFGNIGTFYNNFKKKIGESPERYRKMSFTDFKSMSKK